MFLLLIIIYGIGFIWIGRHRPAVALMLVFAAAPFQNDVSDTTSAVRYSLAEVNLGLSFIVLVIESISGRRRFLFGPILVPAVVYIAICLLASLQQFDSRVTIIAICQTALYFIVAVPVFASLVKRTRDYLLAYYAICAVGGLLATAEMFYGSNYVL